MKEDMFTTKDIARVLGMTTECLNKTLINEGLQYKKGGSWLLHNTPLDVIKSRLLLMRLTEKLEQAKQDLYREEAEMEQMEFEMEQEETEMEQEMELEEKIYQLEDKFDIEIAPITKYESASYAISITDRKATLYDIARKEIIEKDIDPETTGPYVDEDYFTYYSKKLPKTITADPFSDLKERIIMVDPFSDLRAEFITDSNRNWYIKHAYRSRNPITIYRN